MWRPVMSMLLLGATIGIVAPHVEARERPNVLIVSIDSLRRDALGCYGAQFPHAPGVSPSPNLDRLAAAGIRMTDAYAPSPWTLPSHVSLLTGQSPLVHHVESDLQTIDPDSPMLAAVLRDAGYRTAGVFSGPYLEPVWGFGRGFERYHAAYGRSVSAASTIVARLDRYIAEAEREKDEAIAEEFRWLRRAEFERVRSLTHADKSSERVTGKALEELGRLGAERAPWFLFVHYFDVHYDYVPPAPWDRTFDPGYRGRMTGDAFFDNPDVAIRDPADDTFERRVSDRDLEHLQALYAGEVAWVDDHVGRLLARLDAMGVAERTLVVVVSDHGDEFFEHGGIGHRRNVAEEVIRIPMLMRLPAALPVGGVVPGLVSLADVVPTVLDLAGVPLPNGLSGRSLLPLGETEDGRLRPLLSRLVRIQDATASFNGTTVVPIRMATVREAFRFGSIKIVRRRRWPLIPPGLPEGHHRALQYAADRQFRNEELAWIDLARHPAEPTESYSTNFRDPAAHRALGAVRRRYHELQVKRTLIQKDPTIDPGLRGKLEGLGYVDGSPAPTSPRHGFALPAPYDRRTAAPR